MIDPSDLPPELRHLIEKREREDRRVAQRRNFIERRQADVGPLGAAESLEELENLDFEERRSGDERRQNGDRRKQSRREGDNQ
ncbi:MAG: hypothetical protein ACQESR_21770 [Planctomycetota bacterium]